MWRIQEAYSFQVFSNDRHSKFTSNLLLQACRSSSFSRLCIKKSPAMHTEVFNSVDCFQCPLDKHEQNLRLLWFFNLFCAKRTQRTLFSSSCFSMVVSCFLVFFEMFLADISDKCTGRNIWEIFVVMFSCQWYLCTSSNCLWWNKSLSQVQCFGRCNSEMICLIQV